MTDAAQGRYLNGARILAVMAAVAFWIGWYLQLIPQAAAFSLMGGFGLAAPVLLLLGRQQQEFLTIAALLLTVFPVATLILIVLQGDTAAALFGQWRLWPVILTTLGAALALSLIDTSRVRTALVTGAFILALAGTILMIIGYGPLIDRWLLKSAVHFLIILVACVVFAAQAVALMRGGFFRGDARFVGGMIQLLPLLGFAGTILGIMTALRALPQIFDAQAQTAAASTPALNELLTGLAGAFETTLLGLFSSIAAAFINSFIEERLD